jgi:pseudouridine synthase
MRLNRFIAQSGVTSRRKAEALIAAGRVQINGVPATHPAREVKAGDSVSLDGKPIGLPQTTTTIVLYKPRGVTTSLADEHASQTVADLLAATAPELPRLNPVGRLDRESEGLLLLTNDGDLHQQLTHPSFEHEKEYEVRISRPLTDQFLESMAKGMRLTEGHTGRNRVERLKGKGDDQTFRITLRQGWKRQLRRMVEAAGEHVTMLKRIRVGRLELGDLQPGQWRPVDRSEIL